MTEKGEVRERRRGIILTRKEAEDLRGGIKDEKKGRGGGEGINRTARGVEHLLLSVRSLG